MVVILMADGFEEIEALTPFDLLKRAGHDVKLAFIKDEIVKNDRGIKIVADISIDDICVDDISLLILPGGMPGTTNLMNDDRVISLVQNMNEKGKLIAAICAAPMVLDKAGVIDGKTITCYPTAAQNIKSTNATSDVICHDGNIITSKGAGTAMEFALYLIEVLNGKDKSNEVSKSICYGR